MLQNSQPSYICLLFTIQPPGSSCSSSYISLSRPPVSFSLKLYNRSLVYAAPALWNRLPKDTRQFPLSPLDFTAPLLALSSAKFHSRLKTELFKLSYPDSTPAIPHLQSSNIMTDSNHNVAFVGAEKFSKIYITLYYKEDVVSE